MGGEWSNGRLMHVRFLPLLHHHLCAESNESSATTSGQQGDEVGRKRKSLWDAPVRALVRRREGRVIFSVLRARC